MSSLSAHFCPLVRVGSAAPFTAGKAEEGAVAAATAKTESLAKVDYQLVRNPMQSSDDRGVQKVSARWRETKHPDLLYIKHWRLLTADRAYDMIHARMDYTTDTTAGVRPDSAAIVGRLGGERRRWSVVSYRGRGLIYLS